MSNGFIASNANDELLDYHYQWQHEQCGHTINKFGQGSPYLDQQREAGIFPRAYVKDMCSDCTAHQKLNGQTPDIQVNVLRSEINWYVSKLYNLSRDTNHMRASLNKANAELEKLRKKVNILSTENTHLNYKFNLQGHEVGELRKKVGKSAEGRLLSGIPAAQKQASELQNLKIVTTTGYINPIASGFSTLKNGLVEHRWDPFVLSLFTELEEAVRRNDYEEICEIHDRMQSFAEAFDNELKERIEKAEKEIIKQCEEGVERLLAVMF